MFKVFNLTYRLRTTCRHGLYNSIVRARTSRTDLVHARTILVTRSKNKIFRMGILHRSRQNTRTFSYLSIMRFYFYGFFLSFLLNSHNESKHLQGKFAHVWFAVQ